MWVSGEIIYALQHNTLLTKSYKNKHKYHKIAISIVIGWKINLPDHVKLEWLHNRWL